MSRQNNQNTSLQLALENDKLKERRAAYDSALQDAGKGSDDIIGYAFAVNGKLNSADVYSSNGLFRKMWPKQLQAAATEAIGDAARREYFATHRRRRDGILWIVPSVALQARQYSAIRRELKHAPQRMRSTQRRPLPVAASFTRIT